MHALDLLQQQPGMLRQGLPGGCRADASAAALQTLNPKRGLHGTNARTGGGQRQMAEVGARRNIARLHHIQIQAQINQVEMHILAMPQFNCRSELARDLLIF